MSKLNTKIMDHKRLTWGERCYDCTQNAQWIMFDYEAMDNHPDNQKSSVYVKYIEKKLCALAYNMNGECDCKK